MLLAPMRYKSFIWPHNPRLYEISFERRLVACKVPFGRYVMQDLGLQCRVLRGEGEFCGPEAYDTIRELGSLFYQNSPGTLIHPVWQTASAYFAAFSVKESPMADYVGYSFEFRECFDGYDSGLTQVKSAGSAAPAAQKETAEAGAKWYTVVSGDTLWSIAKRFGLSLAQLVAMNRQIKNINLIYPGDRVRVA